MRTIVLLLLLANLTFLGYRLLDNASTGEAIRLAEQVQPEKIRLLSPQQVAALGPAKTAALADVCAEWGPFADAERNGVLTELEPLALGRLLTQKRSEVATPYWVFVPPLANRAAAEQRVADIKARGVKDAFIVDSGPQRLSIALGVFRSEEAAGAFAAQLVQQGVTGARSAPRAQPMALISFVIRDPPAEAVAKLRELALSHPDVELKIGACE